MDADEVWQHTHEQRRALAALLGDLSDEEWTVPSLCDGWTVREVAAHVMRSATVTPLEMAVALVRFRGRYNTLVAEDAARAAQRPVDELMAEFSRHDGCRRRPLGTSVVAPLLDVLVHSQDIAVPLGRPHPMPIAPAVVAARRATAPFVRPSATSGDTACSVEVRLSQPSAVRCLLPRTPGGAPTDRSPARTRPAQASAPAAS